MNSLNPNWAVTMVRKCRLASYSVMLLAVVIASCTDVGDPSGPDLSGPVDVTPWQPVVAPVHLDTTFSAVIDSHGGELRIPATDGSPYGYVLEVDSNTVKSPTRFSIHIAGGERYLVDLHATQLGPAGMEIDVGRKLLKSVVLCMSFHDSPHDMVDVSRLVILYVPDKGRPEPITTFVERDEKYVYAALPHFSKYTMALN